MHKSALKSAESDVLLHALELVHVGTWSYDVVNHVVHWSDELFRLVGLEPHSIQLTKATYLEYIHPDDRDRMEAAVMEAYETGSSYQVDTRIRKADGTYAFHLARGSAQKDAFGKVVRLSGASLDITERVEQQEALRLSEERFRTLAKHSNIGFVMSADQETILSANKSFGNFLGYTPEELVGKAFVDLTYVDDRAMVQEEIHPDRTASMSYEKRYVHKAGNVVWARVTVTRLSTESASPELYMGLVEDITEAKLATEQLRAQKELLETVMDNLPLLVSMFDSEGQLIFVNREWTKVLGWTLEEVQHLDWPPMFYPDEGEREKALAAILKGSSAWVDLEPVTRAGKKIETAWMCVPISDGTMLTIGQDTTLIKQMRQRLAQSEKMEAIGQLAGGIAHDFNNLLTVIATCATFLKEDVPEHSTAMDDITEILAASKRAAALTGQLLAFSRQQILKPVIVDVNNAVAEVAKSLARLIPENIQLSILPGARSPRVEVDQHQLQQVLLNLAVNARDAMPDGGLITIETKNIASSRSDASALEDVVITVTDTGCGISGDVRQRMFDPFFTTKPIGKGTGLGLATVHGIVEQSGGRIEVDTKLQEGSTFRVILPGTIRDADELADTSATRPVSHTETVLLVEDETALRQVARRILTSAGYTVLEARHGADALRVSNEYLGRIDLLITDIVMPELGGKELAVELRKSRPGTPVLFMSGYTDDELMRRGIHESGVEVLRKPFLPGELESAAANLLKQDAT